MKPLYVRKDRASRRKEIIEEPFDASGEEDWNPRYNIAPTQPVPVIRQDPKEPRRVFSLMRWGSIPSCAKDMSGPAKMINARADSAYLLPAFRDAMKSRRCLIPADGFYEWRRTGTVNMPVILDKADYEWWLDPGPLTSRRSRKCRNRMMRETCTFTRSATGSIKFQMTTRRAQYQRRLSKHRTACSDSTPAGMRVLAPGRLSIWLHYGTILTKLRTRIR
jgi:putative SOS response-associated peptidase YedK